MYLLSQVIPLPETESGALRQAFLDHGQSVGIQLSEVPRDTPITEVGAVSFLFCLVDPSVCYVFSWPILEYPTSWLNSMKVVACSQE